MSAFFLFEGERLVCERIYFDANPLLRQLGIAHDPLSLKGRLATALKPGGAPRAGREAVKPGDGCA